MKEKKEKHTHKINKQTKGIILFLCPSCLFTTPSFILVALGDAMSHAIDPMSKQLYHSGPVPSHTLAGHRWDRYEGLPTQSPGCVTGWLLSWSV